MRFTAALTLVAMAALGSCESSPRAESAAASPSGPVETRSLLGRSLVRSTPPIERRAKLEADLEEAMAHYRADPKDEDAIIWYGRRLGYLGRFNEAIGVYSKGLGEHPESYRLLRHRGHRYITLRRFDDAVRDLRLADQLARDKPDAVEPDGDPNPQNQPRSTDRSNIYYHLGLAYYLRGENIAAERTFARRQGLEAYNDDMLVSTTHWRYLALRRAGREREAPLVLEPIREGLDVIENHGYYALCMMYKGLATPETTLKRDENGKLADLSIAYGVAAFKMVNGQTAEATTLLEEIANAESWASFGVIAAEADLARTRP